MAGRPRKRTDEEVMAAALEVFRERGFDGASLQQLSEAAQLGPSSLYARFGSKEGLYEACLAYYVDREGAFLREALALPDARDALLRVLEAAPRVYACAGDGRRAGCAVLSSGRPGTAEADGSDALLLALREGTRQAVEARITQGIAAGELRPDLAADEAASWMVALLHGLSALARDGAPLATLQAVGRYARPAIEAWYPSRRDDG